MSDVMGVAPRGRPIAPGKPAVLITNDQTTSHGGRDDRRLPADVQRLGLATDDDATDGGVAREPADGLGMHRPYVLELAAMTWSSLERKEVHDHRHVRSLGSTSRPAGA
jgi:hypothetical protein